MPLITIHYAPIIKRRETLESVTHRAYGPYALCVGGDGCTPPSSEVGQRLEAERWLGGLILISGESVLSLAGLESFRGKQN